MYFHCKNPNTLPLPIEKNQHYKGQKSLFLRIGQSAWYNLTIWPFLCILTDQNRWCLHLWGPHRLINCISILMKAQHSFKDFLFSENSFSLIGDWFRILFSKRFTFDFLVQKQNRDIYAFKIFTLLQRPQTFCWNTDTSLLLELGNEKSIF